jgi:translation initiation factor 2 subunit 3
MNTLNEHKINGHDMSSIMVNQPVINIGVIGHVADGKSTLVKCLTFKETQQYSKEKERNITIRLGYANAKIWKCYKCQYPTNYSSSDSSLMTKKCETCGTLLDLITHVSFVDCPGHNELTTTMLNGSAVMDYAVLVESSSNTTIPAPQTAEHLIVTKSVGVETIMVAMNKIDLVKQKDAKIKIEQLQAYLMSLTTNAEKTKRLPPIIPISATLQKNIDIVCACLSELAIPTTRNPDARFKMIVIRSFDVNKPGNDVTKLHGGVIGGTIMQGTLNIGDKIKIYPGITRSIPETEKKQHGALFRYDPMMGSVRSIKSDKNELKFAIPGGLLGIEVTIDPSFAKSDQLSGSLVVKCIDELYGDSDSDSDSNSGIHVYDHIIVKINMYLQDQVKVTILLREKPKLMINVNSNNITCSVERYSKTKQEVFLILDHPVVVDGKNNYVTIINSDTGKEILARGMVVDGIECEKM